MAEFSMGDRVSWNTSQGRTHGTVVEKKTKDFDGWLKKLRDDAKITVDEKALEAVEVAAGPQPAGMPGMPGAPAATPGVAPAPGGASAPGGAPGDGHAH